MRPTDNPWASVVLLICATCLGLSFSLLLRPDSTLLFFAEISVIVCSYYSGLALHSLKSWAPLRVTFGAVALQTVCCNRQILEHHPFAMQSNLGFVQGKDAPASHFILAYWAAQLRRKVLDVIQVKLDQMASCFCLWGLCS